MFILSWLFVLDIKEFDLHKCYRKSDIGYSTKELHMFYLLFCQWIPYFDVEF